MIRLRESEDSKKQRLVEHVSLLNEETQRWNEGSSRPMTSDEFMVWLKENRDTRRENDQHALLP